MKVKVYDDDEFLVINVLPGLKGKSKEQPRFVCQIPKDFDRAGATPGGVFKCPMNGKHNDLKKYLTDPSLDVGRIVTVQYQGFTNKEGVPRFPKALRFRKDI